MQSPTLVPAMFFSHVSGLQPGELALLPIGSKTKSFSIVRVRVLSVEIGKTLSTITVERTLDGKTETLVLDPLSNDKMVETFIG